MNSGPPGNGNEVKWSTADNSALGLAFLGGNETSTKTSCGSQKWNLGIRATITVFMSCCWDLEDECKWQSWSCLPVKYSDLPIQNEMICASGVERMSVYTGFLDAPWKTALLDFGCPWGMSKHAFPPTSVIKFVFFWEIQMAYLCCAQFLLLSQTYINDLLPSNIWGF